MAKLAYRHLTENERISYADSLLEPERYARLFPNNEVWGHDGRAPVHNPRDADAHVRIWDWLQADAYRREFWAERGEP